MDKKLLSVITPTYNEQANVTSVYQAVASVMASLPNYNYEHIFIDNGSTDDTIQILRVIAEKDKRVKLIFNARNFGHIRSAQHAILECHGDAVVLLGADLQQPPELIREFVKEWEKGYKIVAGVKTKSGGSRVGFWVRSLYYKLLGKLTDVPLIDNFMGFGLFDRQVIDILRQIDDPYPYFRGLIAEIGFEPAKVEYKCSKRKHGKTKNNLYTLFDMAMLGLTNNTKVPLRIATMLGTVISAISFLVGLVYLIYKLIYWSNFELGLAPLVIGLSFLGGVQILFLGLLGEYIGAIYTQVLHRPLVIEKERVNFD